MSKQAEKKVLIVEDDALLLKVLTERCQEAGFKVDFLTSGLNVTEKAKKEHPTVILLDLILPGLDGFGVLRELKAEAVTAAIPVVVMSNLSDASEVKSAMALGAETFFVKAATSVDQIIAFIEKKVSKT